MSQVVEQTLIARQNPATIASSYREQLRVFYRQELAHLDAVIRFNADRRNKIEKELRDLEAAS